VDFKWKLFVSLQDLEVLNLGFGQLLLLFLVGWFWCHLLDLALLCWLISLASFLLVIRCSGLFCFCSIRCLHLSFLVNLLFLSRKLSYMPFQSEGKLLSNQKISISQSILLFGTVFKWPSWNCHDMQEKKRKRKGNWYFIWSGIRRMYLTGLEIGQRENMEDSFLKMSNSRSNSFESRD